MLPTLTHVVVAAHHATRVHHVTGCPFSAHAGPMTGLTLRLWHDGR